MANLKLVCLVFSFVCFALSVSNLVTGENKIRVIAAGLAFWEATSFLV